MRNFLFKNIGFTSTRNEMRTILRPKLPNLHSKLLEACALFGCSHISGYIMLSLPQCIYFQDVYSEITYLQDIFESFDVNQSNTEEKRHDKTDQSLNDSNLTANNSSQFNQQNYYGEQVVFEYPAFSNEERLLIGREYF